MTCYKGTFICAPSRPIAGRIFFEGLSPSHRIGEATLWVGTSPPAALPADTVGLILIGNTSRGADALSLPLPVFHLPSLPEDSHGCVALLDPESSTLSVRPDLPSIGNCSERMRSEPTREPFETRTLPRLSATEISPFSECDGLLIDANAMSLWEECFTDSEPFSLTLLTDANEATETAIKQLYTFGILGSPSLLLRGIRTPAEWQRALRLCYRCLGDLWRDGREFNGYLPRGLMIDTPMALYREHRFWGCDFLCVDYDLLASRYAGTEGPADREACAILNEELSLFFKRHHETERRFLLRGEPNEHLLSFFLSEEAEEIYLSPSKTDESKGILERILKKRN